MATIACAAEPGGHTAALRQTLFLHQDGFVLGMILGALAHRNVLECLLEEGAVAVGPLAKRVGGNRAYLHVALRCLSQQGWLSRRGEPGTDGLTYEFTEVGRRSAPAFAAYQHVSGLLRAAYPLEHSVFEPASGGMVEEFAGLVRLARRRWCLSGRVHGLAEELIEQHATHLDGALVIPAICALWRMGHLNRGRLRAPPSDGLRQALALLDHLGWYDTAGGHWTDAGTTAREYLLHYGMVGSYLPMLVRLPALLFGGDDHRTRGAPGLQESHVDRRLNVLASAAAHERYFRDADEIFLDLFNREPLRDQPPFIADIGCGDGSWLAHIYALVRDRTKRGRALREWPLLMIGADYNTAAIEVTRRTLSAAAVPALVLFGDITDPDGFARDVAEHGLDFRRGLHIRSFIDHNRRFRAPGRRRVTRRERSTGAYVDESGQVIGNAALERELVEFLQRWVPYVRDHGLVVLEAHCVEPGIAARHVGELHSIAFDAYHGFSHQYPVDFEVFMRAADMAGLEAVLSQQRRYPSRKPFVAVSINRFVVRGADDPLPRAPRTIDRTHDWHPQENTDPRDGDALHRLLYEAGRIGRPRRWCSPGTDLLLRPAVALLSARMAEIRAGTRPPRLTVLDYGTGTGMAAIELLKACGKCGLLQQSRDLGIDFRVHLLDVPSSWFATSYRLLESCEFVRFHALRDGANGAFRPVTDLLGRHSVDLIIASMVLHLIPVRALARLFEGLSAVLRCDGKLLWNSPDLGPAHADAVLFHDPNRALRRRALEAIANPATLSRTVQMTPRAVRPQFDRLAKELDRLWEQLTIEKRAGAETTANRQILPVATDIGQIDRALAPHFEGVTFVKTFEMRMRDAVSAILIPSNQRYLTEVEDPGVRQRLMTLLMLYEIIPSIRNGRAGTACGFNVQWTYGDYNLRSATGPLGRPLHRALGGT